jgi:hypothetical protein
MGTMQNKKGFMNRYPYIRKEYTVAEIAYLAGIIDGEGCIYIGNFSCNKKTGVPYYQTNIQVTNTDKKLIDWLLTYLVVLLILELKKECLIILENKSMFGQQVENE